MWRKDAIRCIQDLFFPPICVLCGAAATAAGVCSDCYAELPWLKHACRRCARPLPATAGNRAVCGSCLSRPPAFNHARSAFRYEYPVDILLHDLKYRDRIFLGRTFGTLMGERLRANSWLLPDILVPVPMHPRREGHRGFNQAREIARGIAGVTGLPVLRGNVIRSRATVEQTGLGQAARRRNVRGAFVVKDELPFEHVAIVDDVSTTCSTAGELARTLRRAGVSKIGLWTVARAGLPGVL